jgi:hypothetical protein
MPRFLLLALLLLLLGTKPVMSFHIVDPWPDPAIVQDVREETIAFPSSDPFIPRDIAQAPKRTVSGLLFLPKSATPDDLSP